MKKITIMRTLIVAVALLTQTSVKAQGTTYVSNLDLPPSGNQPVGNNSWLAIAFYTGNNPGGYQLNSVQLGMTEAAGGPSGFLAMIYGKDPNKTGSTVPGTSLGSLNGSSDPDSGGIFTYTSDANITLLPHTGYFIVLTAESSVSTGAYDLGLANAYSYNPIDGWYGTGVLLSSVNGLSWDFAANNPLYAINATTVTEPSVFMLFALGGLPWAWRRLCRGS